jgi:hypothetical protein
MTIKNASKADICNFIADDFFLSENKTKLIKNDGSVQISSGEFL